MTVDTTSFGVSTSYLMTRRKTVESPMQKLTEEQVKNAVQIPLDRLDLSEEEGWKLLNGVETTETVAEDGTVTKTMTGGCSVLGMDGVWGKISFQASVSFDPAAYQRGELGAEADLMAAAREAQRQAIRDTFSGAELEEKIGQMEEAYQQRKDEAANSFAEMAGGALERRGQPGEVQKLYRSVQAVFASFEAKYEVVAASVDKDSWMDADLLKATIKLQKAGLYENIDTRKMAGFYTLQEMDLMALGLRSGLNLHA